MEDEDIIYKFTQRSYSVSQRHHAMIAHRLTFRCPFPRAWETTDQVLPSFADALSEWLGVSVLILGVMPSEKKKGDMVVKL